MPAAAEAAPPSAAAAGGGAGTPPPDIGRPIDGLRALVLDRRLQPVPAGVTGQLWVGGAGLARGYLGRPALTAERFRPDPFGGAPGGPPAGSRLYATGDLVRWLTDGRLDFLGRSDDQVKIRGFRIEPGEIERVLEDHPAVRRAAVVAVGGERLAGFWEPAAANAEGNAGTGEELRRHLEARLPPYMVPADLEPVDELPLNPHGKIDRRALAGRAAARAAGEGAPRRRTSGDPREEIVAGIFAELLVRETPPGVDEDFFALGGHSLLAARVAWRIEETFGVELPLAAVFSKPTAAGLARWIAAAGEEAPEPIPATGVTEAPLSFAQQRLWLLDRMIEGATPYHIARAWDLEGPLDPDALRAALGVVVDRHAALRTTLHPRTGGAVQRVAPADGAELPLIDLSDLPPGAAAAAAEEHADESARRRFDLAAGPPWRARLLRLGPGRHRLILTLHHVAADGWALDRLLDELGAAYAAAVGGDGEAAPDPPELTDLSIQYPDYAVWQRERLTGEHLERLERFWIDALAGVPQALDLPGDRARPSLQTFRGGTVETEVPPAVAAEVVALARGARATPFMALLTAFGVLLGRLANRDDLLIGTPVAGRDRPETEPLVGLFVNTLALRLEPRGRAGFRALLEETRRTALAAYAHREMPFERLVERLAPQRDLSRSPLFQVLFGFEDGGEATLELAGIEVAPRPLVRTEAHFDLALFARRTEAGGFGLTLSFNRDLFDPATVERFGEHLGVLLAAAAAEPERPVADLPLLAPAERDRILYEWNDTAAELPVEGCLHHGFERHAAERPGAPAVVTAGGEVSYGELDRRADRLAWRLRRAGVGVGTRVAVRLERTPRLIEAVLAVHKAGGAYVPVEAEWPANRVKGILADHGIRHLVCDAPPPEELAEIDLAAVVRLDRPEDGAEDRAAAAGDPAGPPPTATGPDDLAYIIFTSGSTGKPKGVMVRHRPALNLIEWVNRTFGIGPDDRVLFITALSFDLSVYDVFGILAAGGSIRLVDAEERRDPRRLVEILTTEPVTFWDSAPAALVQCVPFFPPPGTVDTALRLVFLSGDWVPLNLPQKVRRSFLDAEVVALGGATEATVWSNFHRVDRIDPDWASIPYGRPIANARYHVLDRRLEPCPIGVPGDLYIGGACLSDGYAEAPRQTALQFVPDPCAVAADTRPQARAAKRRLGGGAPARTGTPG
jgi:amino acid adenylation domain-containing protein